MAHTQTDTKTSTLIAMRVLIIFILPLCFSCLCRVNAQSVRTDRNVYAQPTPTPPPLGAEHISPVFGTSIVRLTDAANCVDSNGFGCGTFYNQWPTVNVYSNPANARIFYRRGTDGEASFNTLNLSVWPPTLGTPVNAPTGITGNPGGPQWQGAAWSTQNPDVIITCPSYADGGAMIYSYNVATTTWTLIKDLTSTIGVTGEDYFFEPHMAGADDIFTFGMRRTTTRAISSVSESGTTVTVNTTTAHNLIVGDSIEIAGVTNSSYNGFVTVASVVDSDTFTYADLICTTDTRSSCSPISTGLSSSSGGTVNPDNPMRYVVYKRSTDTVLLRIGSQDPRLFAVKGANVALPDKSGRWIFFSENGVPTASDITSVTESGTTVTVTTSGAHSFAKNDPVAIEGVGVGGYNGTFTVATIPSSTTFTYTAGSSGLSSSSGGTASRRRVAIWDSQNDSWYYAFWNVAGDSPSHGDMGTGILAGRGAFTGSENVRSLTNASSITTLMDWKVPVSTGTRDFSEDCHSSLYADNESRLLLACYDYSDTGETHVWENEIMKTSLSDPLAFWRLAHHYSKIIPGGNGNTQDYWALPKATTSKDGRYIFFTSNWLDSGRTDLYVLKDPTVTTGPVHCNWNTSPRCQ